MSDFKNKTVWITGASSGIGKAIVQELDKYFVRFILSSRRENDLDELRKTLKHPDKHLVLPLDLSDISTIDRAFEIVKSQNTSIDFLFNNGGISQRSEAIDTTLDVDRKIFETNYFGNIYLSKLVLPLMIEQRSGHIIVTSSIAGKFGFFLRSAYSASKHALHGYYESLRLEVEKYNVKVTILCPGKINTPISISALTGDGSTHGEMDHNQATGMSSEALARLTIKAIQKDKKEVLIGGKEIMAVKIRRFLPQNIFWKIMRKQSPV